MRNSVIKFIINFFIKDSKNINDINVREKYGVLSGVLGIICNLFLFILKLIIGLYMNSIAVISDSFNNLSDTASSFITILGSKMSSRRADKEHPFGHGRMEYIASLIVSFLIIIVGFELLKTSFKKIFDETVVYLDTQLVIILLSSIIIKVWMYLYNRYIGNLIKSKVILAASQDSLNDVITTSAIIITAISGKYLPFSIDGYVGMIIASFIMYSGYRISKNTIDSLLGTTPDEELVKKLEDEILSEAEIVGIHDLIIHDYGTGFIMATVHAEVNSDCNIIKIHEIIDHTENEVLKKFNVTLVIHIDPIITDCEETNYMRRVIIDTLKEIDSKLSIHDFRMTKKDDFTNVIFDLCIPSDTKKEKTDRILNTINKKVTEVNKNYKTIIKIDNIF